MNEIDHLTDDDAYECWRRWQSGVCVCCGMWRPDEISTTGVEPETIAEGIMICGFCVEGKHLELGVRDWIIRGVVRGAEIHRQENRI